MNKIQEWKSGEVIEVIDKKTLRLNKGSADGINDDMYFIIKEEFDWFTKEDLEEMTEEEREQNALSNADTSHYVILGFGYLKEIFEHECIIESRLTGRCVNMLLYSDDNMLTMEYLKEMEEKIHFYDVKVGSEFETGSMSEEKEENEDD